MRGDEVKELLSAFLDGEASEHEVRRLLGALAADRALRATWERYHLVQQVLRNELGPVLGPGFAERVSARLAAVEATDAGPPARSQAYRAAAVARWSGFLAVAASVAALTLYGWQALITPSPRDSATLSPEHARLDSTATTTLAARKPRADTPGGGDDTESAARRAAEAALNIYLVEHNEFAPTSGVSGMLPYVRVVGYDSER
jgi:sigma-E factor negative regulatory protein RseA